MSFIYMKKEGRISQVMQDDASCCEGGAMVWNSSTTPSFLVHTVCPDSRDGLGEAINVELFSFINVGKELVCDGRRHGGMVWYNKGEGRAWFVTRRKEGR